MAGFSLHPNMYLLPTLRGRYCFEENGYTVGMHAAFSEKSLIGLKLFLPRMLGATSVMLVLHGGNGERIFFPLRLIASGGAQEIYGVMLTRSMLLAEGEYDMSLTVSSAFGMLAAYREEGGTLAFTHDLVRQGGFPPLKLATGANQGERVNIPLSDVLLDYLVTGRCGRLLWYITEVLPAFGAEEAAALPVFLVGEGASSFREQLHAPGAPSALDEAYERLAMLVAATIAGDPVCREASTPQGRTYWRHVMETRGKESTFVNGRLALLFLDERLLAFSRVRKGEALVTLINRSPMAMRVSSADGFSVLLGGRGLKNECPLAPHTGILLRAPLWEGDGGVLHIADIQPEVKCRQKPPIRRPRALVEEKNSLCERETVIRSVIDF